MPKSRKQKTGANKKKKPGTKKQRSNVPLSKTTTETKTSKAAVTDSAVTVLEADAPENRDYKQPSVVEPAEELGTEQIAYGVDEDEFKIEDYADVSEERASIISIVQGLEGQVETAFKLKEVLEADLEATQRKLSEELAARAELEARIESLEAQAALVNQVREDISFAEEERNKLANLLSENQQQLEAVTNERDSLAEKIAAAEPEITELESEKTALEAQVMNLKDKVADMVRLHKEVDSLQDKLSGAEGRTGDLRVQLEQEEAANKELVETRSRLESELKTLNINYEAAKNELDAFKKALRDIRSEVTLTSGRVRQRYFKPKNKK
ncbi:MAG: hypothetical protein ACYS9Y_14665 [Planctomycetota bacterium]|jgi:chromosome segregation ATPase